MRKAITCGSEKKKKTKGPTPLLYTRSKCARGKSDFDKSLPVEQDIPKETCSKETARTDEDAKADHTLSERSELLPTILPGELVENERTRAVLVLLLPASDACLCLVPRANSCGMYIYINAYITSYMHAYIWTNVVWPLLLNSASASAQAPGALKHTKLELGRRGVRAAGLSPVA